MALNKAHSPVWVKVVIIVLIVGLIILFSSAPIAGILDLFNQQQNQNTASTPATPEAMVVSVNTKYEPQASALATLAASAPTSYTAQVNLANSYFDWAQELTKPATGQSQPSTPAIAAAIQVWAKARSAYDAATKLNPAESGVQTDRAVATYYSDDTTGAIVIARKVVTKDPKFAPAWLNLGLFYDTGKDNVQAVAAYQKYLILDPTGSGAAYAKQRLSALGGSVPASTTP